MSRLHNEQQYHAVFKPVTYSPGKQKSGPYGPLVFALSVAEHLEDIVKVVVLA